MSTDGLLNDNREERKLKELKYILYSELRDKLVDVELPVDALWNWIQAYVKEEVARVDNSALVEEIIPKRSTNIECRAFGGKWDNKGGTCFYCGKHFGSVLDFTNHIMKQ